ncbi:MULTISPECIES: transcriptional repressor [unclassified Methanobrevibacter]|uniref:transcriptional repressor n=1 Tax=unclassified Methanobrevibacter TaxID=2638681 RepID=UPI0027350CB3|nr:MULTISPECIES: transcriptional repressor [unclassified Methanobrevibacter]
MLLNELFGENARIKILEELLTYVDSFLTADEISRMSDVSIKTVYIHMNQLEEIGILDVEKKGAKKFKLDANDERVLALGLIEANEFLRRSERLELSFEISEISSSENIKTYSDFNQVELLFDEAPILEFSTTL